MADDCDILQVRIDRDPTGAYQTLAMGPDGRTARGSFQSPMTNDDLDDFVQRVGLVRRRRGATDDRLRAIKEFGSVLHDALFTDEVASVYDSAKAAAFEGNRRLRISLGLSGAPELLRLPWEFLYDRPRFIAESTDTPLVRSLDVGSGRRPQRLTLPLRVLGIVSSPVGYDELDADSERQNLETALQPLRREGLVELMWLERATLRELGRRVSEPDEIHVIHYIGHGAYDEATEAGILVLERSDGRAAEVSGEVLGAMLQDERSLRLVVLNSCEGARTSHVDPFSGVATSLIEFNIPAVIGMQFEITDDAAIAFSDALYRGLAQGMPIDAAIAPARRAIMSIKEAEFGTPVLFLRDGDAHLFAIDDSPVSEVAPSGLTRGIEGEELKPAGKAPNEASAVQLDGHVGDTKGDGRIRQTSQGSGRMESRPSTSWRGSLSRSDDGTVKKIVLRLQLDRPHEIVIADTKYRVMLEVDGQQVSHSPTDKMPDSLELYDGGATRICALETEFKLSEEGWVRELLSCRVDGLIVRLSDEPGLAVYPQNTGAVVKDIDGHYDEAREKAALSSLWTKAKELRWLNRPMKASLQAIARVLPPDEKVFGVCHFMCSNAYPTFIVIAVTDRNLYLHLEGSGNYDLRGRWAAFPSQYRLNADVISVPLTDVDQCEVTSENMFRLSVRGGQNLLIFDVTWERTGAYVLDSSLSLAWRLLTS